MTIEIMMTTTKWTMRIRQYNNIGDNHDKYSNQVLIIRSFLTRAVKIIQSLEWSVRKALDRQGATTLSIAYVASIAAGIYTVSNINHLSTSLYHAILDGRHVALQNWNKYYGRLGMSSIVFHLAIALFVWLVGWLVGCLLACFLLMLSCCNRHTYNCI